MARQILFVQGAGEGTHDRWDSKLVASLERELGDGYAVRYPRMPGEDDPSYPAWQVALAKEFRSLEDGAILVGHSLGGAFLIHMLAEPPPHRRFGGLFVVAARPSSVRAVGRAMASVNSRTSPGVFRPAFPSFSITALTTPRCPLPMFISMRKRFRTPWSARWYAGITSSTTI